MPDLKQSTSATVRVGPVVDTNGDIVTDATLTIKLSKAGGALAARNDATAITHDSDGYYLVTLNTTDTNTIGRLDVAVTGSGFLPFAQSFAVLHANVYDWLYGSTAPNTTTPLDAAGIRTAVGLSTANLDTQLADLPTVSEFEARSLPSADYFVVSDYTAPLDAAGVRSAVGLASANLDTQLSAIDTVVDSILDDTGTSGVVINLSQTGITFRDVSAVAEASVTVGDTLAAAFVQAAGDESVSGTTYTKSRPAGTAFRTFTLDDGTTPTSRT